MQDLTGKTPGSQLTAAEWNQLPQEVQNLITSAGIGLNGGDTTQLNQALSIYIGSGSFYIDGGAADAYVVTGVGSLQNPTLYTNGQRITFVPANSNTGASTINVASVGAVPIVNNTGGALTGGEIIAGTAVEAYYSTGLGSFVLLSSLVTASKLIIGSNGSAAFNLNSTNHNEFITTSNVGTVTVTMQAPIPPFGDQIIVKRGAAGGQVNFVGGGGITIDTIQGGSNSIETPGQKGSMVSIDATTWEFTK